MMLKTDTQPTLTAADMALAGKTLSTEQKEAYALLLNWQPEEQILINGRFLLEKYLGRGGFGLVFSARDSNSKCRVALKFLNPDQVSSIRKSRRIQREFNIARKVNHSGLVKLISLDIWQGIHFLVMEYIEGITLGQFIQNEGPLNWQRLEPIAHSLIDIVSFLHNKNIIHRDIKPSNIMVCPEGQIKLLDLGMSRELDDPHKTSSTGELVGSPHYLPPELIRGMRVTPASDVYQIALVIYFSMTGQHPFEHSNAEMVNILGRQLTEDLTLPKTVSIPFPVRHLLYLSLKKSPTRRPQNAQAMTHLLYASALSTFLRMFSHLGKRSKMAVFILILALTWMVLRFGLPLHDVRKTAEGDAVACNLLGVELWRKPSPAGQVFSLIDTLTDAKNNRSVRILQEPRNRPLLYQIDRVTPGDYPLIWLRLNSRGGIESQINLSRLPAMDHFDFFPLAMIKSLNTIDINKDGRPERFISIRNALSMFPSLITIWGSDDHPLYTLYTPGSSDDATFYQSIEEHAADPRKDLYCFSLSNPYCHYYLWAWGLENEAHIPPSFSTTIPEGLIARNIVFLPQNTAIKANAWAKENRVELICTRTQQRVVYERSGKMSLYLSNGEVRYHQENFVANDAALSKLNKAYSALYTDQEFIASRLLASIDDTSLTNPWFRSLIEYYRAEAASRLGQKDSAWRHLEHALEHDPVNFDAQNRQCELLLISRGPKAALEKLNQTSSNYGQFWGLAYGQDLFRFCCALWAGRTAEAVDLMSLMANKNEQDSMQIFVPLTGMIELFLKEGGNPSLAIKNFSTHQSNRMSLFDISEQQMILARLLMLEGDRSQAQTILNYHYKSTRLYRPLSAISLGWCLIEDGQLREGIAMAQQGFTKIRSMAVAQFWPRFWLFYDAYAYGRAMEKAGMSQEARLGYETCIEANPHTGLAADAAARLKQL